MLAPRLLLGYLEDKKMKNDNELISVIVPVYNTSKYLSKCIESILSQTYSLFELILVDDGSKDDSLEICKLYQKKDSRVIALHQKNAGVSAARNKGMSVAKGSYFCFIDSDDFVENILLEKLYYTLKKTGADISICGFNNISSKGITPKRNIRKEITGKERIADFVLENYLGALASSPCGKLYKKIQLEQLSFDNKISIGEDLKFNIQYFAKINKIVVIEDCLYNYIDVEGSLTHIYKTGYYEAICNVYETTLKYLTQIVENIDSINLKNVNYKLFSYCVWFISQNVAKSNFKKSRRFIKMVCNSKLLQKAVCDLPEVPLAQKVYAICIKKKYVLWLWLISFIKSIVKLIN